MKSLIASFLQIIHRIRNGITLSNSRFERQVDAVVALSEGLEGRSDGELKQRFHQLRHEWQDSAATDAQVTEAFAIIREAAARTVSMRPYDVQMLAAFALNDGKCVEMQTGEGKTLAAALVVCLQAALVPPNEHRSVHILTFNDYLAERDANWMKPLFDFFDMSVGHVVQGMSPAERKAAYRCCITYITAKEAGFDFLRDQLCQNPNEQVQHGHHFAIVDEADSILIDEARIPLVIATEDEKDDADLYEFARRVQSLQDGLHFEIKSSGRNISFTDAGLHLLEEQLGIDELHSEAHADKLARLNLALQAQWLLTKDVDYLVLDDAIELIDEFTGRVAENRKWPGGLQAALEAKEGLPIQPQGRILNSITLQSFLSRYEQLAGMTGTAVEATEELEEFYRLKVVILPPNRPCVRTDHLDRIFRTVSAKIDALADEVTRRHQRGQPILIGTASVEESESLAARLQQAGISCRVLNAANDSLEAEIISEAGALGAVTISTNMAGRGTDIALGGSRNQDHAKIAGLGGLYVIGTNRHESRRIDNQLRGRSGRQGDPGESEFFISLEDNLISRHGIVDLIAPGDSNSADRIDDENTANKIAHIQRIIEGESFEIRRTLRVYSQLLELQRQTISSDRTALLNGTLPPTAFKKHAPEYRQQLVDKWGEDVINDSERRVTLIHLDWCWSDHLAHAAEIRQGIHLVSYGGFNPYDVFNREMRMEFDSFLALIEERVVETMKSATYTKHGIDLEKEGLTGPSSTWTFMINDNPRGTVMSQLIKGVVRKMRDMLM